MSQKLNAVATVALVIGSYFSAVALMSMLFCCGLFPYASVATGVMKREERRENGGIEMERH
jgi:hypothetical protein